MADLSKMEQVVAGASSKSEKMRRLAAAGYSRKEIKDFLGVRYQFVRNVLVEEDRRRARSSGGFGETTPQWEAEASPVDRFAPITVGPNGSAVIPASVLAEAGLQAGDSFVTDVAGNGDIRLLSGAAALRRAQELVRQSMRGKAGLVDEILEERRRDARALKKDADKRHA